ncbi:MAG: MerR family transcriptional regulator [Alphaproteobacteria bacterium]|nr:MerR family transcriptional regulator [Alphaproteobacteria bacterium]
MTLSQDPALHIGAAARASGVSVKAIRHYEAEGLLGEVPRRGRYRRYAPHHVERLRLIAHCRAQGFSLPEIRTVVAQLPQAGCPAKAPMLALVEQKLAELRAERDRLQAMIARLEDTHAYIASRAEA